MRYFVGDIMLLPNQGEAQIRNQIANRLRIPSNSFRFEWVNRRARLVDNRLMTVQSIPLLLFAILRFISSRKWPPSNFLPFTAKGLFA